MFFYQPAGVSVGLWLPAGFSASLPAFLSVFGCLLASLPACRRFCRSLAACWLLCQSSGVSAGLWLPAGFSASLSAFLSVLVACWFLCLSAGLCVVLHSLWSAGRQPLAFFLFANAWCFSVGGHIATSPLICAASTFSAVSFQLPSYKLRLSMLIFFWLLLLSFLFHKIRRSARVDRF